MLSSGLIINESDSVRHKKSSVQQKYDIDDIPIGLKIALRLQDEPRDVFFPLNLLKLFGDTKKVDLPIEIGKECDDLSSRSSLKVSLPPHRLKVDVSVEIVHLLESLLFVCTVDTCDYGVLRILPIISFFYY